MLLLLVFLILVSLIGGAGIVRALLGLLFGGFLLLIAHAIL